MIFDILDDKLVIRQIDSKLKPRHKSQLSDWGFTRDSKEDYLLLDDNVDTILPKVLKYFNKSNIDFSLSDSCKSLINEILKKIDRFRELIEAGKKFKEGEFDKDHFAEHLKFLSSKIA